LSPVLHRAAYEALGLNWQYDVLDVAAPELPDVLAGLGPEWRGLSLTMPLKQAVLPLLTRVDPLAKRLESVNTVVLADDARVGHNTDVWGLVRAVREATTVVPSLALVLGAGATARSALAALRELGVTDVAVSARREAAASDLVRLGRELGVHAFAVAWPPPADALTDTLVISTVPSNALGWLGAAAPRRPAVLVDVLYEPWPTPAVGAWEAAGGTAVGGLAMLVHQAVEQVRLMTGSTVDPDILRAAAEAELDRRRFAQAEQ
jgi:shikimate dehydrogenase